MSTLQQFSEKERDYHAYQARLNYLRQQGTIEWERDNERQAKEEALQAKEAERQAKEEALQAKEKALAEIERLKALLEKSQLN